MQYDIFGLGDALVDLEYAVSEEDLKKLKLSKGCTLQINGEYYQQLVENFLKDIPFVKTSGGSTANTIAAAQLLGAKTFYCGRVANDSNGQFFSQEFCARNVATDLSLTRPLPGLTGQCIVLLTPDGERTMVTFKGISENLSVEDLAASALLQSHFIYTGGFLVSGPSTFATALQAHNLAWQNRIKRVTTLAAVNIIANFREELLAIFANPVDLLFCNEQEALLFANTQDLKFAQHYLQKYANSFVITLGGRGSIAFDGSDFYDCAAEMVTVVNTLGAGDVFAGAFMFALVKGFSFPAANKIANVAAGRVVSKWGPRLDEQDAVYIKELLP